MLGTRWVVLCNSKTFHIPSSGSYGYERPLGDSELPFIVEFACLRTPASEPPQVPVVERADHAIRRTVRRAWKPQAGVSAFWGVLFRRISPPIAA